MGRLLASQLCKLFDLIVKSLLGCLIMASVGHCLVIILYIGAFTVVHAGESLFQIVGKRVAVPEQESHGHDNNRARHESADDVFDYVSAGDIWNEERMMNILGIEDGEDEEESDSLLEREGEDPEVPSILSALYNKINEPESNIVPLKCRIPGMKGNVVRMLNNKGNILYQDETHTIVELQFSMKHAFHEYENVTEAQLKVSVPEIGKHDREFWDWMASSGLISAPRYKYEIFPASDKTINNIRRELYEWKTAMRNGEKTDIVQKHITPLFGQSLITKSFRGNRSTRKLSIDVKLLVNKWRNAFLKKKRLTLSRAILVVIIETESLMTKQCPQAMLSKPRLLLVSLDKRQCPMPVTSYLDDDVIADDEKVIERHKRDLQDKKNLKKRKRKRKGRRKSKAKNPSTVQDKSKGEGKSSRTPDLVRGESLHNPQSRSTRSTICRRYPMYVSFNDVGWGEWIIAPRGYQAYRCAGECPYPLGGRLNGTNHAVLATMMHSVDPWSTPQPCCVPTSLRAMSLLYFDTGKNVVLRQYEDMVVGTCGCR